MQHPLLPLLLAFSAVLGACTTGPTRTEHPVETGMPRPTSTVPPPGATSTATALPTASPTPRFVFDLSEYDPDISPPIFVQHQPQLIVRPDETVTLSFEIINIRIYCDGVVPCPVTPTLHYSYGAGDTFQNVPLVSENIDGLETLVARLPATDRAGRPLRYYAEFAFPEAGYTQRYPAAGTIDLFAVADFLAVELPVENPVEPGDKVYKFYWGYGPNAVHTTVINPIRIGPAAMDVAGDGRIALLNPVDNHVLIYDPRTERYTSFPLPFPVYPDAADLAFDRNDRLVVCDFNGKKFGPTNVGLPYCYRLLPDAGIDAEAPVYVQSPLALTRDLKILNSYDYRLGAPFDPQGAPNSREVQRQKEAWKFPQGFVQASDGSGWHNLLADVEAGVAFEVKTASQTDGMAYVVEGFEKTPQGYLMLFNIDGEQIRAVWINSAGAVLKDVTLPGAHYSVLSQYASVAVAQDGSLYVMSSTQNGIEIHFVSAP